MSEASPGSCTAAAASGQENHRVARCAFSGQRSCSWVTSREKKETLQGNHWPDLRNFT